MKIVRIRIKNFRCIKFAEIFPECQNVLLGPNNEGKTAILEALNLVLNPEITYRARVIDENDFYQRRYLTDQAQEACIQTQSEEEPESVLRSQDCVIENEEEPASDQIEPLDHGADVAPDLCDPNGENAEGDSEVSTSLEVEPRIYIELCLSGLSDEDEDKFRDNLVAWRPDAREVVDQTVEGIDPFEGGKPAVRVFFEGWYDSDEDDFFTETRFLKQEDALREDCPRFGRDHKRHIGFLIYRDFRGLTRPVTLEPSGLFNRLLQSQGVTPKNFEDVLDRVGGCLHQITAEGDFASVLNAFKAEMERFMPLGRSRSCGLHFELTDRTRDQLKNAAQIHVTDNIMIPLQKMGAGTRSLAILAMLTMIMRRRGRGILALEEPETFLFPHAQRRVVDECLALADQLFLTTHSPYVLERIPVEGVGRIEQKNDGSVTWSLISPSDVKQINLYTKRLRQVHCEALLGRGVLIVEGDSDKWWILGVSRILHGKVWNNRDQEAFELAGIAVVNADSNGDIVRLGNFFAQAGLKVVGLFDRTEDVNIVAEAETAPFRTIFLDQAGLEEILATELPTDILRRYLTEAPHSRNTLKARQDIDQLPDAAVRNESLDRLKRDKGSGSMHEWLISLIDEASVPQTIANIVDLVGSHVSGLA